MYVCLPYRPDVARLRPAQLQYYFRRPVVTSGHDRTVVLVVKRGTTEINQTNIGALDTTNLTILLFFFGSEMKKKRRLDLDCLHSCRVVTLPFWS